MQCVICKTGEVRPTAVQAEIKIGYDHLLVRVQAEACNECREPRITPRTLCVIWRDFGTNSHEKKLFRPP
jgi:hypothetical protein